MGKNVLNLKICVNCRADIDIPFICNGCEDVIDIAPDIDYFDLFDIPHKIEVDNNVLQAKYIKLQSALHPDRFTNKSLNAQQTAVLNSSVINSAYKVLSNKFDCAQYLVYRHTAEVVVPADFTALSFEWYERKIEGEDLTKEVDVIEASLWRDLSSAIEAKDWQGAGVIIAKLKIIKRFKN